MGSGSASRTEDRTALWWRFDYYWAAPLSVRSLSKIAHIRAGTLRTTDAGMVLGRAVKCCAVEGVAARAYNQFRERLRPLLIANAPDPAA
jgi:hypothetical protein